MFLSTWGIGEQEGQDPTAGMTLLSPLVFAGELCPYLPRMSRFTPSDGIKAEPGKDEI